MGFLKDLKDMKQAFQEGYSQASLESEREERMIANLQGRKVTATEAREVFMKIKEDELEEEFLEWVSDNEIKLK